MRFVLIALLASLMPAWADASVNLYGMAQLAVSAASDGANRQTLLEDTGSRFGLRAEEALGNGLAAFFQIESAVAMDTGSRGAWASREGWLGLKSPDWGRLRLGRGNTYFNQAQEDFDGFNGNSTMVNALQVDGAYIRISNSIGYETPVWAGLDGRIQYADMEGRTGAAKPHALIGAVHYRQGPFSVVFSFEQQRDLSADVGVGSKAVAVGERVRNRFLGMTYTLPSGTDIKAGWRQAKLNDLRRHSVIAILNHPIGDYSLKAGYLHAGKLGGVANSGGNYWALGGDCALSKRTSIYTEYSRANNGSAAAGFLQTSAGQATSATHNWVWASGLIHVF